MFTLPVVRNICEMKVGRTTDLLLEKATLLRAVPNRLPQ